MRELEKIIGRYFQKDGKAQIYYNLSQDTFNKVVNPKNLILYEKPDILSVFDNQIVGIEHFEFDSFKRTKKGSDFKIKENQVEKRFENKMQNELKQNDSLILHDKIETTANLKNYFDNFKHVFLDHYNKIDSYIKHIEQDFGDKEIHICFFAEDVSPLGSYFFDRKRKINLLMPLFSDEIVEMLEECSKVEYLIIGLYAMSESKIIIIENKADVLERFKKERQKVEEKDFFCFEPETTGYAVKIPNKK